MNCKQAYAMIHDHVDGRLRGVERVSLKRHVARCRDCAEELRVLRSMGRLLDAMPLARVPHGFADRVIATLKAAGLITERAAIRTRPRSVPAWLRGRARGALAGAVALLITLSLLPATINPITGLLGKGAVLATDAFLAVQEQVAGLEFLNRLFENFEKNLRTLRTVVEAGVSLVATAGGVFFIPALAMVLVLSLGFAWYFRAMHRRSAHHASFSF